MTPQTEESIKLVVIGGIVIVLVSWFASTMHPPKLEDVSPVERSHVLP